jgi:ubiquinone/menaquinone biosynthesis C-methylase UbiE
MTHEARQTVRADFDRLASLADDDFDHNTCYHGFLLRELPARCANALEVGCGTGRFARALAERAEHVLALDLSPQMIRRAREHYAISNLEFEIGDVTELDLPAEHFDYIVSIATLHHLPLDTVLSKLKRALKPAGVLAVLDLYQVESLMDYAVSAVAMPVSVALRIVKTGRLRPPRAVREAWEEHGRNDVYLTLAEVRQHCAVLLPGAVVRRHLLWRYSIIWRKKE